MKTKGFTLIEMVLTLVVGAILVMGIAGFVEFGTKGYADSVERQRLQTQAKFVLEKMTREIRHAVPNVFIQQDNCLSFYGIRESGFYAVSGANLNFIVGDEGIDANKLKPLTLVINPTELIGSSHSLADLDNVFSLSSVEEFTSPAVSGATFSLVGAAHELIGNSVAHRLYITDGQPITYCLKNQRMERNDQPLTDGGDGDFSVIGTLKYQPATVQNSGIVHIDLSFSQGGETSHYQQQVQVLNVP